MSQLSESQVRQSDSMQVGDSSQRYTPHALALIAVGAILRTASFFYSANSGGDAWARLGLTAEWLKHPVFKLGYASSILRGTSG